NRQKQPINRHGMQSPLHGKPVDKAKISSPWKIIFISPMRPGNGICPLLSLTTGYSAWQNKKIAGNITLPAILVNNILCGLLTDDTYVSRVGTFSTVFYFGCYGVVLTDLIDKT